MLCFSLKHFNASRWHAYLLLYDKNLTHQRVFQKRIKILVWILLTFIRFEEWDSTNRISTNISDVCFHNPYKVSRMESIFLEFCQGISILSRQPKKEYYSNIYIPKLGVLFHTFFNLKNTHFTEQFFLLRSDVLNLFCSFFDAETSSYWW